MDITEGGNICNNQGLDISIRLAESNDNHILYSVFKESRSDLNWIYGISEEQKEVIMTQQFKSEKEQLKVIYPVAELNVIMFNSKAIGRLYINYGQREDRILEIGLLEEYRKRGIGSNIVNRVIKKSLEEGKGVSLQVTWFNQGARSFYERLGFKIIESNGITYEMKYINKNKRLDFQNNSI